MVLQKNFLYDGLLQVFKVGLPWRVNTSVYFWRLGRTLIDTGPPNQYKHLKEQVLEKRSVDQVILTHHHEDHAGCANRCVNEYGLPVSAPQESLKPLAEGFELQWYRKLFWGIPTAPVINAKPLTNSTYLEDVSLTLNKVHTPGHSDDHCVLHVPEKGWLFGGDIYVTRSPLLTRYEEDPQVMIDSLQRVCDLDFDVLFCGHRGVVKDGKQAVASRLEYMLDLQTRARDLRAQGLSVSAISAQLLGAANLQTYVSRYDWDKRYLIRGLLGEHVRHTYDPPE